MSQANVRSHDAIREFKLDLINFADEARNALDAVEMEIHQIHNWLCRDQLAYWRTQIKRCQEAVAEARTELHRRKLSQMNSVAISDSDQREALKKAQRRLEEAEDKVVRIKKWIPILEHAVAEYHSQSQPLGDRLTGRLVASLNLLDRMIGALESYLTLQAPSAPELPPLRSSPGEPATTSAAAPGKAEGTPDEPAEAEAEGAPAAEDTAAAARAEGDGSLEGGQPSQQSTVAGST
jgi:hypothetical protein